jgi:hypothetical protein
MRREEAETGTLLPFRHPERKLLESKDLREAIFFPTPLGSSLGFAREEEEGASLRGDPSTSLRMTEEDGGGWRRGVASRGSLRSVDSGWDDTKNCCSVIKVDSDFFCARLRKPGFFASL